MKTRYLNPEGVFVSPWFTHAVGVADAMLVHVAGQVAYDGQGEVVGRGDMRAQAARIFDSLGCILAGYGAGFRDVVKITGFMVNLTPANAAAYREVRARYFDPAALPASTLVGVSSLVHPELLLEVEAVFAVPAGGDATKVAGPAAKRARPAVPPTRRPKRHR